MKQSSLCVYLLMLITGCKDCVDVAYPSDFKTTDYEKYPIFNKMINRDTFYTYLTNKSGKKVKFVCYKTKATHGYDPRYSYRTGSYKCEKYSYINQLLGIQIDSIKWVSYAEFNISKCNTTSDISSACPDSVSFIPSTRYIGDTTIGTVNYKNVMASRQTGSYSLFNKDSFLIYIEIPYLNDAYTKY